MSDFKRGVGLGAGLATGWVLMLFVVLPLVFIGGCAVLIAASSGVSGGTKHAQPFSHRDAAVLARRAESNVRDFYPRASHARSRCRFVRRDTLGPDSWDYACKVLATTGRRRMTFTQRVQCFDPPHYSSFDGGSCTLNGPPERA